MGRAGGAARFQARGRGTPFDQAQKLFQRLKKEMKARVRDRRYADDPALEERLEDYDPAVEIAVIANDPEHPPNLRLVAHMELAKYVHPQLKNVDLNLGEDAGRMLVRIAQYAPQEVKQLAARMVEDDGEE